MRWLLWRELTVMTRTPALWAASAWQVALLTGVIVCWADGIPVLAGSFVQQFATVHFALLLAVLPWVAARAMSEQPELALVAAIAAAPVRRVLSAKYLALLIVLLATLSSSIPLWVLAARIGNPSLADALSVLPPVLALGVFVPALVVALSVTGLSRFPIWAVTTAVTIACGAALSGPTFMAALGISAGLAIAVAWIRADRARGTQLRWPAAREETRRLSTGDPHVAAP